MFLHLNHYKLDVYQSAGELKIECYKALSKIPDHEKFNIIDQILNITEGC
ncbi:four helix bundle protein [Chryseobacterium sp. 1B4]